tara:strand:- start:1363 stop:3297 length:1935 start_codon:yes stop_codon:yes gene_type:complete
VTCCFSLKLLYIFLFFFSCINLDIHGQPQDSSQSLIDFNYKAGSDIKDISKRIFTELNKNLIYDQKFSGKVEIIVPQKIPLNLAYQIYTSALNTLGFTTIETSRLTKIVSLKSKNIGSLKVKESEFLDSVIAKIIYLKYIQSSDLLKILTHYLDPGTYIDLQQYNAILITNTNYNLRKIERILTEIDVPNQHFDVEIYFAKHILAKELYKIINGLELEKYLGKNVSSSGENKIILDSELNALILAGKKSYIDYLKEKILFFDTRSDADNSSSFRVYKLNYLQAKDVLNTLQKLRDKSKDKSSIEFSDSSEVFTLGSELKMSADEASNAIVVEGYEKNLKLFDKLLNRIDKKRAQVHFKVSVLEIVSGSSFQFSASQIGLGKEINDDAKIISGWQGGSVAPIIVQQAQSNTNTVVPQLPSSLTEDFVFGVFSGNAEISGLGKFRPTQLLKLIKNDSNSRIVSEPYIISSDRVETSFSSGDTYAFLTESISSTGAVSKKVEKESSEISVLLTPHITKDNELDIDLELNLTSIVGLSEDGYPRVAKRKIKQKINTYSGQTVFVSGYSNFSDFRHQNKVPILGDLPILGYFFKTLKKDLDNTRLLFFITPHIIYGQNDLSEITNKSFLELQRSGASKDEFFSHFLKSH